jgi:hypothetical protein
MAGYDGEEGRIALLGGFVRQFWRWLVEIERRSSPSEPVEPLLHSLLSMFIHRYKGLWLKLVRRLASEGYSSAKGEVPYRILDMYFGEFFFQALG